MDLLACNSSAAFLLYVSTVVLVPGPFAASIEYTCTRRSVLPEPATAWMLTDPGVTVVRRMSKLIVTAAMSVRGCQHAQFF